MNDCIFCKIVAGDIPSHKIYEDDDTFAFLSIGPINDGHTLVIPKAHSHNALAMDAVGFQALAKTIYSLAPRIKEAVNADGINIIFNCEAAAGQEVFHTHAHIAPRFVDDGYHWWKHKAYDDAQAACIAEKIRENLS